jgi:hypothetical protein
VGASTSACGVFCEVELRQDRQRERRGLARAGLRGAEHVAAGEQRRDRRRLDRRRRLVADVLQRLQDGGVEAEIGEAGVDGMSVDAAESASVWVSGAGAASRGSVKLSEAIHPR